MGKAQTIGAFLAVRAVAGLLLAAHYSSGRVFYRRYTSIELA